MKKQFETDVESTVKFGSKYKALEILPTNADEKQKNNFTIESALEVRYGGDYLKRFRQNQLKARIKDKFESLSYIWCSYRKVCKTTKDL